MIDKHLNLFYTYNRDAELIENNLTRAFIVFLSVISGETRHRILSALLKRSHRTINAPVNNELSDFTSAHFALQSNIDRSIPKSADWKVLFTISTEPLDISSCTSTTEIETAIVSGNNSSSTSVPDAWIYDDTYCFLIEAKVGSYPLNISQLQSHANDWFGSSLERLSLHNSLCSITWIDILETLKDTLKAQAYIATSEETLLRHIREFIGYYGYRLFEGIVFYNLDAPPDFIIGALPPGISFQQLAPPPDFMLMRGSFNPQ